MTELVRLIEGGLFYADALFVENAADRWIQNGFGTTQDRVSIGNSDTLKTSDRGRSIQQV